MRFADISGGHGKQMLQIEAIRHGRAWLALSPRSFPLVIAVGDNSTPCGRLPRASGRS